MTETTDGLSVERIRPYWHIDLKWISGQLSVVAIGLTLIFFSLAHLTTRGTAIEMISTTLATAFAPEGLDEPSDLEFLRHYLADKGDDGLKPIPGLAITITATDVKDKTPRELRLLFFRRLAEPLYDEGPDGVGALAETDEMREAMQNGLGPLALVNQRSHRLMSGLWMALGAISLVLLGGLIFFSRGLGRLISPGITLTLAALPGTAAFTIINRIATAVPANAVAREDTSAMMAQIFGNVAPAATISLAHTHQLILLLGVGLIVLATIGKFAMSLKNRADAPDTG